MGTLCSWRTTVSEADRVGQAGVERAVGRELQVRPQGPSPLLRAWSRSVERVGRVDVAAGPKKTEKSNRLAPGDKRVSIHPNFKESSWVGRLRMARIHLT